MNLDPARTLRPKIISQVQRRGFQAVLDLVGGIRRVFLAQQSRDAGHDGRGHARTRQLNVLVVQARIIILVLAGFKQVIVTRRANDGARRRNIRLVNLLGLAVSIGPTHGTARGKARNLVSSRIRVPPIRSRIVLFVRGRDRQCLARHAGRANRVIRGAAVARRDDGQNACIGRIVHGRGDRVVGIASTAQAQIHDLRAVTDRLLDAADDR